MEQASIRPEVKGMGGGIGGVQDVLIAMTVAQTGFGSPQCSRITTS